MLKGFLGEEFRIERGVHQGCPLSPGLFVCGMEPLAQWVRREKRARGIAVPGGGELRVTLYMDDVTFVAWDEGSVRRVVDRISEHGEAAGSQVNSGRGKC